MKASSLNFSYRSIITSLIIFVISACSGNKSNDANDLPKTFGFGRSVTPAEIAAIDIDIAPDGHGLPAGSGSVSEGSLVYQRKCASCHGNNGKGGPAMRLVAPMDDTTKAKAIGNYWPYSTTLFDYIRRAMPYNMPGSLSNSEVYHLTAFLLYKNKIIDSTTIITPTTLPRVKMPAQRFFVADDRRGGPEVR